MGQVLHGSARTTEAVRRAVRLGCGGVDRLHVVWADLDQSMEQAPPNPFDGPTPEAIIDRGRRPIERGAVLPTTARLQHMHDAADHPRDARRTGSSATTVLSSPTGHRSTRTLQP